MTDTRKAMEMALEVLSSRTISYSTAWREQRTAAIESLKAALAAQGEKQEARKPLTTEQIYTMYSEPSSDAEMVAFAREVEKAHGIMPDNDHEFWIGVCESLDVAKDGVQAQVDAAFESMRKRFVKLPKYSFVLSDGGVRRIEDRCGNWVEFSEAHSIFEPPEVATHPDPRIKELECALKESREMYDEAMCASNEAGFAGMSAAQTIKALEAEHKELESQVADYDRMHTEQIKQRQQLEAERDAALVDAAKWREYKARKDAVIVAGMTKNALRKDVDFSRCDSNSMKGEQ